MFFISVFIEDEYSPVLNNHRLIGDFKGLRSINVSGDWRAIFQKITLL